MRCQRPRLRRVGRREGRIVCLKQHRVPEPVDFQWVFADQQRLERRVHEMRQHFWINRRAFTYAGDAFVGRDLDDGRTCF